MNTRSRWRTYLEVATSAALLGAAVVVVWTSFNPPGSSQPGTRTTTLPQDIPLPTQLQTLKGAQLKGAPTARVAVIEYSDFQCPFCRRFAVDTFPSLEREYIDTGRIRFAFRHLPLEKRHPLALKAAEAAECAGREGRFWEMHDAMFADGAALDQLGLLRAAAVAGLNAQATAACLAEDGSGKIRADASAASELQLRSTPVFLVGVIETDNVRVAKIIKGAQPLRMFAAAIDEVLAGVGSGGLR